MRGWSARVCGGGARARARLVVGVVAPAAAVRARLHARRAAAAARHGRARALRGRAARRRRAPPALAAARLLAQAQGRQKQVPQEEGLRPLPLHLRPRVPQHVLAVTAHERRRVPPVRRVPGRAQRVAHRARGAVAGRARPHQAQADHALPALVRGARRARGGAQPGVQVRVEQQVGQLPRPRAAAVPAGLRAAGRAAPPAAGVRVAGGGAVRPRHQQPARAAPAAPAAAAQALRCVRQGPGLPARGPVRAPRGVDRAGAAAGRRQGVLLRAAGAPQRDQGPGVLRGARRRERHAHHAARRPAQPAGAAAHVPQEEDHAQAPDGADPVQRLPVPAHVRVPVAGAAGHRRGDRAAGGRGLGGAHGPRAAAGGAGAGQGAALLLPRVQPVLPGLAAPRARLGGGRAALHAHAAARVPHAQLHQARHLREGLPRDGPRAGAAQPLPAGLPGRRLLLVPAGDAARAAAALPRRLRHGAQQVLRRAARAARAGHGALALEGAARAPRGECAAGPRLPAAAPVTAGPRRVHHTGRRPRHTRLHGLYTEDC